MRTIFLFALLHSFFFCFGQTIEVDLPKSDYDSLNYSLINVKFDITNQQFFISDQTYDATMGFMILRQYEGNLDDIDSIYVSTDKLNKACKIEFHSCDKDFQIRRIPISTYIIDDPEPVKKIYLNTWRYETQYEKLVEIAQTLNSHLPKNKNCKIEVKNISMTSRGMSPDDGLDYVFLNGHCAKSKIATASIRKHLKSCFTETELNEIDLVDIKIDIDEENKLVVDHLFFLGTKMNLDKQLKSRISDCLQNLSGWTKKEKKYGKYQLDYLFAMSSPDLDKVAKATFEELKQLSVERQNELDKKRNNFNKKYTKKQRDSIFNESVFQSLSPDNGESDDPYNIVEKMPTLKDKATLDQINQRLSALHPGIEYSVVIRFIVDRKGDISDIKCMNGRNKFTVCDDIKKIFSEFKQPYIPGKQRGKVVAVYKIERLKNY